jgi:HEPN domain-containing protein
MADREKTIRRFERAAKQRLAAALFLFEREVHYLDAVYLAVYAVECSLKAMILRRTPRNKFADIYRELTEVGAKGHNFDYLLRMLRKGPGSGRRREHKVFGDLTVHLLDVASWSTELRYQAGVMEPADAERFLRAAGAICELCARS